MGKVLFIFVVMLAGCATTKTPTATNLADSSPLTTSLTRPAFRDAQLTVTDPKTGEVFTGRIPGTKPRVGLTLGGGQTSHFSGMTSGGQLFSGTTHTHAPPPIPLPGPDSSMGVFKGSKGGTLLCQFQLRAGTGLCVTPAGGYVYLDF